LRMHPVSPPSGLVASRNNLGGIDLNWSPSADPVLGYHVYRAARMAGPFQRLTEAPVGGASYTDAAVTSDGVYMVKALRLELSGSGTYYNCSQGVFAAVSPAATLAGDTLWPNDATGTWKINDATGGIGADPGWDWANIAGTLQVTATPEAPFTVRMISLAGDAPGLPANFSATNGYSWPLVTASAGITGFDSTRIKLLTTEFQGDLAGGVFTLPQSGDGKSLHLVFTPNHPAEARPAVYTRQPGAALRIMVADLLDRFTIDPDGDGRILLQVGLSTNGTKVTLDTESIVLEPQPGIDAPETLSYVIRDARSYRPGDSVVTSTNSILVLVGPDDPDPPEGGNGEAIECAAYHAIEIQWQSAADKQYQLQCRIGADGPWIDQGAPVLGTGDKLSLFERAANPVKLYRIVPVPPGSGGLPPEGETPAAAMASKPTPREATSN
jgi:hypothetical protein